MVRLTGHFDGKVIVPDQPLDAAPNERFELTRMPTAQAPTVVPASEDPEHLAWRKKHGILTAGEAFGDPSLDAVPKKPLEPGFFEGKIWVSDDFDEPLEDFKDYM